MRRTDLGNYVSVTTRTERARAFIPRTLPPVPPIEWTVELRDRFDKAALALGRLDALPSLLPEISLLIPLQMMKEAMLSSKSDGEGAGFAEVFLSHLEDGGNAVNPEIQGIERLYRAYRFFWDEIPLIERVDSQFLSKICGMLAGGESTSAWRRGMNRISVTQHGNASFIPPPPEHIAGCMDGLDLFLFDKPRPNPFLVKSALAQAQLELIQPFDTGNSRLARMVMPMILRECRTLSEPILCSSFHFHADPRDYFEALNNVRNFGEWEEWLGYFAGAVRVSADHSFESLRQLVDLVRKDSDSVIGLGRPAESALKIFFAMVTQPVVTSNWLVERTGLTPATVNKSLVHLQELRIASETTSRRRNRIFCYRALLESACSGTALQAMKLD